ncbi:MAG: hypothetical protein SPF89_01555 [Sphaerochaetaceae bacterium]|nr:hypothetical protein [Spirochaetales bacterium]MDY5498771.1 hypothetical protein [Sphaerochaetaceae bacterium]
MSVSRHWAQVCLLACALLAGSVATSCTVNASQDVVDDTLTGIVTAKAVTNVRATTTEDGHITLTFDGQTDAEGKNLYYRVNYQMFDGPNAASPILTHILKPSGGESSFSYTMEAPSGIHVLFSVDTVIQYSASSTLTASSSTVVEGASLPSVEVSSPIVDGNTVSLSWDDRKLMSALDQSGRTPLYHYKFQVRRLMVGDDFNEDNYSSDELAAMWKGATLVYEGTDTSCTDKLSGNEVHALYRVWMVLMDANGVLLEQVPEISSSPMEITTDTSTAPAEPLSIAASRGTKKEGIQVDWTLPDYVNGLASGSVTHRAKVERRGSGSETWTTLVALGTDINTDDYGYTQDGTDGKASYSFLDTSADANTTYAYRVTAAYYFADTGVIQTQDSSFDPLETEQPGYRTWLPTDLKVNDGRNSTGDADLANTVSWTYAEPSGRSGTFSLTRSDEYLTTSLGTTTDTTYSDSFTLSGDELKVDHTYSYALRLVYEDGTESDPLVSGTVVYETCYSQVAYIEELAATTNLAGKVTLSWNEDTDTDYEHDKVTYTLQSSGSYENLSSAEEVSPGEGATLPSADNGYHGIWTVDADAGVTKYYKLTATYAGEKDLNATYVQVVQGSALAIPAGLKVADSVSQTTLTGSFSTVENAASYKVGYRPSGSEDNYTFIDLDQSASGTVSFTLSREVGAGTAEAGMVYDFVVVSVDEEGNRSACSSVETGSLFGPYGLDAAISDNDTANNSFTVTWKAVPGAGGYNVNLYRKVLDGNGKPIYDSTTYLGSKLVETVEGTAGYSQQFLSSDALFAVKGNNPYPLSSHYLVKVVPYSLAENGGEVAEEQVDGVEGHWFSPPVLTASKAASGTQIAVSWDAVDGAESYLLYQSSDGSTWGAATTVTGTSYTLTTTSDTYFTIASVKGGLTSQLQSYISGDDTNLGYVFKAPSSFSATSNADKPYYTLVWSAVDGATRYYVTEDSSSAIAIDVTDLGKGESRGTEGTAGYVRLSADGSTYTYNCPGSEMVNSTWNHTVSMYSYKEMEDVAVTSQSSSPVTGVYRDFSPAELANIVHFMFKIALTEANKQFGGDWWPPSGMIESVSTNIYTDMTGVTIKSSYADRWGDPTQHNGSMKMSDAPVPSSADSLTSASGFVLSSTVDAVLRASNDGEAGYLGVDGLKYVGYGETGTFVLRYPDKYGNRTATYQITTELNVKESTGTVEITKDGLATSFSYSDLTVKPY